MPGPEDQERGTSDRGIFTRIKDLNLIDSNRLRKFSYWPRLSRNFKESVRLVLEKRYKMTFSTYEEANAEFVRRVNELPKEKRRNYASSIRDVVRKRLYSMESKYPLSSYDYNLDQREKLKQRNAFDRTIQIGHQKRIEHYPELALDVDNVEFTVGGEKGTVPRETLHYREGERQKEDWAKCKLKKESRGGSEAVEKKENKDIGKPHPASRGTPPRSKKGYPDTLTLGKGRIEVTTNGEKKTAFITRIKIHKKSWRLSKKLVSGGLKYGLPVIGAFLKLDDAMSRIKNIRSLSGVSGMISVLHKAIEEAFPSAGSVWDGEFSSSVTLDDFEYPKARFWLYEHGPEAFNSSGIRGEELMSWVGYYLAIVDSYIGHLANLEIEFDIYWDEVSLILIEAKERAHDLYKIAEVLNKEAERFVYIPYLNAELLLWHLDILALARYMSSIEGTLWRKLQEYKEYSNKTRKSLAEANLVFEDWAKLYEHAGGEVGSN